MKKWEQLKATINLFNQVNKHALSERKHSQNLHQCSVVSIFRLNKEYLLKRPNLASKINSELISGNSRLAGSKQGIDIDKLVAILEEQMIEEQDSQCEGEDSVLELIFNERASMKGNRHSAQICFPGGALDDGETDVTAGIREVQEEIGLNLSSSDNVYIGKLPINLFTYLKRGKKTYISNVVFLSLENLTGGGHDPTDVENLQIPNDEVQEAWWVPFKNFYESHTHQLHKNYTHTPTASWLLNTYMQDIISDDETYQQLITNNPHIDKFSPQSNDFHSPLDGILNSETVFKSCKEKEMKLRKYFSDEHINQKELEFSFYGFRFYNGKVLWGITQTLNSCLVELSLDSQMLPDTKKNAKEYIAKGRDFYWDCVNDEDLSQFLQDRSSVRTQKLSMKPFKKL